MLPNANSLPSANTDDAVESSPGAHNRVQLVLTPPMPHSSILRVMILGFALAVLLLLTAAYFGYRGSRQIQSQAQDMAREHLVNTEREAALESQVEAESQTLLRDLGWILGACFVVAV